MLITIPMLMKATPTKREVRMRSSMPLMGEVQREGRISSDPKTLPYRKPNSMAETPAIRITDAKAFFKIPLRARYHAPAVIRKPCPTSPNINPKNRQKLRATRGDGSVSP